MRGHAGTWTLFDRPDEELQRVTSVIGATVLRFLRVRLASGHVEFHADELRKYVADHVLIANAPASADRILRDLRAKGACDYVVVNRRASLYRAVSVAAG